jgi:hypothetical protein
MTRTPFAALLTGLGLVVLLAHPASADDAYVKPPYVCGPVQAPSQVPCDQVPTTTPTTSAFKYCLGYGQQFPNDTPCPRPPSTSCRGSAQPLDCDPTYNPKAPVADAGAGQTATTAPPVTAEVSSTTPITSAPQAATQRRSAPPKTHKRVAPTTTTTLPPLYFAMGHWMTWDEYLYTAHLLSGWW